MPANPWLKCVSWIFRERLLFGFFFTGYFSFPFSTRFLLYKHPTACGTFTDPVCNITLRTFSFKMPTTKGFRINFSFKVLHMSWRTCHFAHTHRSLLPCLFSLCLLFYSTETIAAVKGAICHATYKKRFFLLFRDNLLLLWFSFSCVRSPSPH